MINRLLLLIGIMAISTSCLKQGSLPSIPGVSGPHINVINGKVLFSVGLEQINLPVGVTLPLSNDLEGASITVGPDMESGGSMLQLAFNPKSLENDHFEVVPANTLPNGDAFPFTLNGELPAHAFHIPKALNTTIYASKKLFGFFLPINFSSSVVFGAYYNLKIGGKDIGHFTLVSNNESGTGAGIIVMVSIDKLKANKDVQTAIKYSKRSKYKNRVF